MATDARTQVMIQRHDEVVEAVRAPQTFMASRKGETHMEVIERTRGVVAPAIVSHDRPQGQTAEGPRPPVLSKEGPPQVVAAGRRPEIAFALGMDDAVPAETAREGHGTGAQEAALGDAGKTRYDDSGQISTTNATIACPAIGLVHWISRVNVHSPCQASKSLRSL